MMTSPKSRSYSSGALTRGAASTDELRNLLLNWKANEPPNGFAERVQRQGILDKNTSARLKDIVLHIFKPLFLFPDDRAARWLKELVRCNADRQILNELFFVYKARSEPVLYDFVNEVFWPMYDEGALYLSTDEIKDFLHQVLEEGRTENTWSPNTLSRMARGVQTTLLNVGFLQEEQRYHYAFYNFRPQDFVLIYLAYDFHLAGLTDSALIEHSDWNLFGLSRARVLDRLSSMNESAGTIVQQAGSVVRITWLHQTMEELIHAFYRKAPIG